MQRALRLLEAVSRYERGAQAKQLARETGFPLATTYHLLRTLVEEGYVQRVEGGAFMLGGAVEMLHERGHGQLELSRVRPALAALRDQVGAAAYLALYSDGEVRVVEIADGPRTPRVDIWVGFEDAAHATASGKAVLRALGEEGVREFLSRHPLHDLTPRTITRPADLMRNLDAHGPIVLDREEYLLGNACVAIPFTDGDRIGSVGISMPSRRLLRWDPAIQRHLCDTAERVARGLTLTI
ncbi:transcriptional regulator [Gandjariella thermophila]|uniref:Glycerol operon regulatory protein n=1 Tax=Gandjariella thermophila TaxID=1931992 RepID=A0A4D4J9U2_9PSEU|nr:transcriptional regulator [Gandjariella thermophila]